MKDHALRLMQNERLIEATHWTVFALGAMALGLSLTATAVNVLFS